MCSDSIHCGMKKLYQIALKLPDLETTLTLSFLVLSDKLVLGVYLLLASVHFLHQISPILQCPAVKLSHISRHQVSLALFLVIAPRFATSLPVTPTMNPTKYASFSLPWELDAAWGFEFVLGLASSFPEDALSITGLFDAIGWVTDEELVERVEVRFMVIGIDFAATLSSSFCSCTLFAIVVAQLWKLKLWAQQVEMKWLMLNKLRRLFHSSRVKYPLVSFPVLSWIVSPYFAECAFLPTRYSSRWGSTFCNETQEIPSGFPDRSCSAAPLFHSWEDQDRP